MEVAQAVFRPAPCTIPLCTCGDILTRLLVNSFRQPETQYKYIDYDCQTMPDYA